MVNKAAVSIMERVEAGVGWQSELSLLEAMTDKLPPPAQSETEIWGKKRNMSLFANNYNHEVCIYLHCVYKVTKLSCNKPS